MARDTTVDRVMHHAAVNGRRTAFVHKQNGTFVPTSYRQFGDKCRDFAGALLAEGCVPGDGVAIMGDNTPEWVIADIGAMMARAVPTGIYQTSTAEQLAYIAGHADAKVLVLHDAGYWNKLKPQRHRLPNLRKVVMVRDAAAIAEPGVISFDEFLATGASWARGGEVDTRFREVQEADLATLIYTSGTTGPPKGAMLSHGNLSYMARTAAWIRGAGNDDSIVSYLPLSHIAEQMFTLHVPAVLGAKVVFAESMDKLRETLVYARPTVFLGVPRVWEKFKGALEAKLSAATGVKGEVVRWSRQVGLRLGLKRLEQGRLGAGDRAQLALADRLFFSKLKGQLGLDRLDLAVTGAAPIAKEVLEFFLSCGILIHEVYGQTEGGGATTFNMPLAGKTRLGTAGVAFPGSTVKIAKDGEIKLRGPGVFMGYFKDEAATQATLEAGWLNSGDVGQFDNDGFLRITDRKKDLIITSGGKNIAPQNIEKNLKAIPGISQAVVVGERRNYLTAILTLDAESAPRLAEDKGYPPALEALAANPAFRAYVQREIDQMNNGLSRYEGVKKFILLAKDFSVESGELTPTQKVKRNVVTARYAKEIDALYAEAAPPGRSTTEAQ